MSGPKLLDKKLVNASLATERKQEIDKGVKIAKAVDALKETRLKEERELEEFRTITLTKIRIEIDTQLAENERLKNENKNLKEERIRLEAPLDLLETWQEVKNAQVETEAISTDLLYREINITKRENDVIEVKETLKNREEEIEKSEVAVNQNLRKAEKETGEAQETNENAQRTKSFIQKEYDTQTAFFKRKSIELEATETDQNEREEQLAQERNDINNEKLRLADQRAILARGFAELRRKQT